MERSMGANFAEEVAVFQGNGDISALLGPRNNNTSSSSSWSSKVKTKFARLPQFEVNFDEEHTFDYRHVPEGRSGANSGSSAEAVNLGSMLRRVCDGGGSSGGCGDDGSADDLPLLLTAAGAPTAPSGSSSGPHCILTTATSDDDDAEAHCHHFEAATAGSRKQVTSKAKKQLSLACALCLVFIVGEVLGGHFSHSLAIMSDAAHMLSDFASFCISLFSIWVSERRPRKRFNFGYHRAEVVGALFTLMIIWFVTGVLVYLAVNRIVDPSTFEVEPDPMLIVAGCAVFFNIVLGLLLHGAPHGHSHGIPSLNHGHSHGQGHGHGHSHGQGHQRHINVRAAMIHVLGDLIQSVGVLISSIVIKVWPQAKVADPVCTLMFSVIVMCTTINILRDTVRILMEGRPRDIDYDEVFTALESIENVVRVHDLRLWSLTTDRTALTAHLVVNPASSDDNGKILRTAQQILSKRFDVQFATIQIEDYKAGTMHDCESCQPFLT